MDTRMLGIVVTIVLSGLNQAGSSASYICAATSDIWHTTSDSKLKERVVAGRLFRLPFLYDPVLDRFWVVGFWWERRLDGSVNFYRPWNDYVSGFGKIEWEHWLGLEKIHRLTKDGVQIYFDMEKYDGSKLNAHYRVFTVHGAATSYKMNVDPFGYNGSLNELLSFHDNMKFSTYDRDNDASGSNCCKLYADGGGWWFKDCYRLGMLNSVYGKKEQGGIGYWEGDHKHLKNVTIKVKKMNGVC